MSVASPRPRFYPAAALLAMLALGYVLERFFPIARIVFPGQDPVAWALTGAGIVLMVAAVAQFARAGTTVDPTRPETSEALVTSGVFRISRNPIYLGMLLVLVAFVVKLGALSAWITPPLFVAWLNRAQIRREEQALAARFGDAWAAYCRRTRRWV